MRYRFVRKKSTTSTNDDIKAYFDADEPEGLVVVADHQICGRGRKGSWSDDGLHTLLMSILLRPQCSLDDYLRINYWSGQSVMSAVQTLSKSQLQLQMKWPNDVLLNGRKVCGILQEGILQQETLMAVALGIGLNVNVRQDFFDQKGLDEASSLQIEQPQIWDKEELLQAILEKFSCLYTL